MRRFLRVLSTGLILGVIAWSGWWYAVAQGQEKALAHWFRDRAASGWQAEHGAIRLGGYPFRLVREISQIRLADPKAGWAWAAPWLRVASGPISPTRFEVTWPGHQSFAMSGERTEITASELGARLRLRPDKRLGLIEAELDTAGLEVAAQSGWTAAAKSLRARLEAHSNDPGYDVMIDAGRLRLPQPLVARLDPLGVAGSEVTQLSVDGMAVFDRPLDRRLIEHGRIGLVEARVRQASLEWGQVRLSLSGHIKVDARGYPVGRLAISAEHWRALVDMAKRGGAIAPEMAKAVEGALGLLARLSGNPDRLDATLRLQGGRVWLGPVSIGAAPRLAPPRPTPPSPTPPKG